MLCRFLNVIRSRRFGRIAGLSFVASALLLLQRDLGSQTTPHSLDIVIRHGHVVDGTGSPWYTGDIGVLNGKIAAIGKLNIPAKTTIDASDLVVASGFIDM